MNLKDKSLNNSIGELMKQISLSIGSDHRGMKLKDQLSKWLIPIDSDIGTRFNIDLFHDIGVYDDKRKADYPRIAETFLKDYATPDKVAAGWQVFDKGILICGSGFGMSIATNRHPLVRSVVCRNVKEAEMARKHNDANVLCLGADFTTLNQAKKICEAFLSTKFEGGRHLTRIKSIGNY